MCLALGASRARLARGVALEGTLLAMVSALAAPVVARWLFYGLGRFQLPGGVSVGELRLAIDIRALAVMAGGAVATALVVALISGAFGFSADTADALRSRAGATPRLTWRRTRTLLVAGQVAIVFVLLAGAGLFVRSLVAALRMNAGLDADRIVTSTISLAPHGYSPVRASAFFEELLERLRGNQAIRSVSLSDSEAACAARSSSTACRRRWCHRWSSRVSIRRTLRRPGWRSSRAAPSRRPIGQSPRSSASSASPSPGRSRRAALRSAGESRCPTACRRPRRPRSRWWASCPTSSGMSTCARRSRCICRGRSTVRARTPPSWFVPRTTRIPRAARSWAR